MSGSTFWSVIESDRRGVRNEVWFKCQIFGLGGHEDDGMSELVRAKTGPLQLSMNYGERR